MIIACENQMYVSTQLQIYPGSIPASQSTEPKLDISGEIDDHQVAFRKLDPEYYSWLRYKMQVAKAKLGEDSEAWQTLRQRFVTIHDWALENLDAEELQHAVNQMTPAIATAYQPPKVEVKKAEVPPRWSDHLHPPTGGKYTERISQTALERVQAIEKQALELGWHYDDLYANASKHPMPYCDSWGLICFLDQKFGGTASIGKVTLQSIEIILPNGVKQSFYNHRVEQPWLKFIDRGKKTGGRERVSPIIINILGRK